MQQEGASVVQLLQQRQAGLSSTLGQQFPEMRNTIWQSESSVQAAAQSLTPQMTENKKKVSRIHRLGAAVGGCPSQVVLCISYCIPVVGNAGDCLSAGCMLCCI